MDNNIIILVALGLSHGVLIATVITQFVSHAKERRIFNRQRSQLMNRVMARDLSELAQSEQFIDNEPEDELKKIKAENDLAVRAEKILQERRGEMGGFPVM